MKLAELQNMKPGDDIIHSRYGLCEVRQVIWHPRGDLWGVIVRPRTAEGKSILMHDCGADLADFLETSIKKLKGSERRE